MAEEARTVVYPVYKTGTDEIHRYIFSADSTPRTKAEFQQALADARKGKSSPEFLILEPGAIANTRKALESVVQPIQTAARGFDVGQGGLSAAAEQVAPGPMRKLREMVAGIVNPTRSAVVAPPLPFGPAPQPPPTASGPATTLLSPLSTPTGLMSTGAQAVVGALTGGTSLVPQIGAQALTTLGSSMAGRALVGEPFNPGRAGVEAGIAGLGRGAVGVAQWAMGQGISRQAREKVAQETLQMFKQQYPHLRDDPNLLNYALSSEENFNKFVAKNVEVLRSNYGQVADDLIAVVQARTPGTLSRTVAHEFRAMSKELQELGTKMIGQMDDDAAVKATLADMNAVKARMDALILKQFKDPSSSAAQQTSVNLKAALDQKVDDITRDSHALRVMTTAKRAFKGGKFDTAQYQKDLQQIMYAGDPILERAGMIATRGAGATGGVDSPLKIPFMGGFTIPVPFTRNRGIPIPPLGQQYIGRVQSPVPGILGSIGATTSGRDAIRSFTEGE